MSQTEIKVDLPHILYHDIIEFLNKSRRHHLNIDQDCWYSCPAHPDYCGNAFSNKCDCGADDYNSELDALLLRCTNL